MSDDAKTGGMGKKLGMGCLIVVGVFIVLVIIGAIVGGDEGGSTQTASIEDQVLAQVEGASDEPASNMTGPQRNAARSATAYLSMSGFSRAGLIDQLSSDAGDGYDIADATVAVDSLNVDWNEQAVKSAKQYLSMSGFSCNGLIEQLSSDAGSQFTKDQAAYGAQQAGAC